nr:MAG TPA: hypothetical protein [Caudoviricetes sp.]
MLYIQPKGCIPDRYRSTPQPMSSLSDRSCRSSDTDRRRYVTCDSRKG